MPEKDNDIDIVEELEVIEEDDSESAEAVEEIFPISAAPEPEDYSESPYASSIFPVLLIDRKLRINYANNACIRLFRGFFNLTGQYFIDVFGHSFDMDEIKAIRATVLSGMNGYTWKGAAHVKSRIKGTIQTRVYIFPADFSNPDYGEFVVMFDDVTEENKRMLRSVFLSLLEASKLKDNDTGNHIIRVNLYAERFARALHASQNPVYRRIDADYIENISFLASMHDVGKLGTPDDILNKEGPLSDWEWNIMREHTINGGYILSTYPHPMAKDIALCHHERWNGTGYPYKLEGEMIPLAARIVTIADVYDALRMERSYKPSLEHNIAMEKMIAEKGSHFDPSLLDVFCGIASDFNTIFEENKD